MLVLARGCQSRSHVTVNAHQTALTRLPRLRQQRISKMENGDESSRTGMDPSSFLNEIIQTKVTIRLNSGALVQGQQPG